MENASVLFSKPRKQWKKVIKGMFSLETYFVTYKVLTVYDGTFSEAETTGGTKFSSSSCQCCLMNCFSKTAAR
jgi:hypothetical protein